MPTPERDIKQAILRYVTGANRRSETIKMKYQSLLRHEPCWRWIVPHAIGFDGIRWHTRVFCKIYNVFKDFLLSRTIMTRSVEASDVTDAADEDWQEHVTLEIGPRPAMSESPKKVIALDYGMRDWQPISIGANAKRNFIETSLTRRYATTVLTNWTGQLRWPRNFKARSSKRSKLDRSSFVAKRQLCLLQHVTVIKRLLNKNPNIHDGPCPTVKTATEHTNNLLLHIPLRHDCAAAYVCAACPKILLQHSHSIASCCEPKVNQLASIAHKVQDEGFYVLSLYPSGYYNEQS